MGGTCNILGRWCEGTGEKTNLTLDFGFMYFNFYLFIFKELSGIQICVFK
jgi:hypothetical protein